MVGIGAEEKEEIEEYNKLLLKRYRKFVEQKVDLDMTRGKPCKEQLDLSLGILNCLQESDYTAEDGTDCRNYGIVGGILEAKQLFADLLEVSVSEIIIGGNSSLNLMYDTISRAFIHGISGCIPWANAKQVIFLCPSPGYERHFTMCEHFDIEMIPIEMTESGPDMDKIEALAASNENIKGMWCVPMYSNPEGITYSNEVVKRLATMKVKALDFRIFWDNAYMIHHLSDKHDQVENILEVCKKAGNPDRPLIFFSTSKITFPGAGVAMIAASESNISEIKRQISVQTIGPDKLNQLRHVKYLKNVEYIKAHMKKHGEVLKPKFDTVIDIFEAELGGKGIAWWKKPKGGYSINLKTLPGYASKIVKMASEAGLKLPSPGSVFPYQVDPTDSNIRIAPTYISIDKLEKGMELLCVCVQLACLNDINSEY